MKRPRYLDLEKESKKGMKLEERAAVAWKNYLQFNRSIIVDLFQGQLKNTLTCLECRYKSHVFESFMYLSLPIPKHSKRGPGDGEDVTINDCIKDYIRKEVLEGDERWKCPRCKRKTKSTKKISLWKLPNILVINLKRFEFSIYCQRKIRTFIDFPLRNLNLLKMVSGKQKELPCYDIFGAIVCHLMTS